MNRHKNYWCNMHDARTYKSAKEQHFNDLADKLETLFNMYDKTEVLNIVRDTYNKTCKEDQNELVHRLR